MKKTVLLILLVITVFNLNSQVIKPKPLNVQKFHIESRYTLMTGIVLTNASLAFGIIANYNYQFQGINIENNHNSQINFLQEHYNNSTNDTARAIWFNDIILENDSYDKKTKINKTKYEVNLILASFFFFAGNLMIISGLKNMVVTPNGIGIVYNF